MIWAAVVVGKGNVEITSVCHLFPEIRAEIVSNQFLRTQGKVVGLFAGLLVLHGILVRPSDVDNRTAC